MIGAELVLLERDRIPPTYPELLEYIDAMAKGSDLLLTDVALEVFELMRGSPVPAHIRPVWAFIAFAARGTLPEEIQDLYNITWDAKRQRLLDANLTLLRSSHRFVPNRFRLVRPAAWAERRMAGENIDLIERAREARRRIT